MLTENDGVVHLELIEFSIYLEVSLEGGSQNHLPYPYQTAPTSVRIQSFRNITDASVSEPDDFFQFKEGVFVGGNFFALHIDGTVLLFLLEFDKVGNFL